MKLFSKKKEKKNYSFTDDWFSRHISVWSTLLKPLRKKNIRILEIGVWEGRSTTWILEELMENPESSLIAVDTFEGGSGIAGKQKKLLSTLEERFRANIELTGRGDQVTVVRSTSFEFLTTLHHNKSESFDFIYIDGSHATKDVLSDAVLAWPLLSVGGRMVFDDYGCGSSDDTYNPKIAIDAFLKCIEPEAEVLHMDYQVAIRKKKV